MPNFITLFRGRVEVLDADDELSAATRRIQCELMGERIARGATYEVRVARCDDWLTAPVERSRAAAQAGRVAIVDVAERPGRGATVARWSQAAEVAELRADARRLEGVAAFNEEMRAFPDAAVPVTAPDLPTLASATTELAVTLDRAGRAALADDRARR